MPGRPSLKTALTLAIGLALGWALASPQGPRLRADGVDRWDDWAVTSGQVALQYNTHQYNSGENKQALPMDAIYYLNYKAGYLLAAVPSIQHAVAGTRVLGDFAERDLLADFKLAPNADAHFVMTTGRTVEGWAPLFVFETRTHQVATYRVSPVLTVGSTRPRFELLERRTIGRGDTPPPPSGR